jgi:general secretion pathway protein D
MILGFAAVALAGCAIANRDAPAAPPATPAVISQIREVDLSPRFPQPQPAAGAIRPTGAAEAQSYYGEEGRSTFGARGRPPDDGPATTGALTPGTTAAVGPAYEMNFENAPVATVAKAILGDILGVGYTIDPRVQATVSLSSGRPVPRKDILYVFESALRVSNVALVREARGYRLIPLAEAPGSGSIDGAEGLEAGYGITVVPLQYVSAPTLTKLLENFAAKPGMVRADPSRNLVLIQGNAAERRAAIDTVMSFDADWMAGQSVGIYPLINSTPEPIITELDNIIDGGEGGLSQSVVKLQPINRQNAILVVSRKPEYLRTVSNWITRLDKSGGARAGVRVYRMRYGDARTAAELLNNMFVGGSAGSPDNPMNQLAPGGGAVASGSRRPSLIGNAQQGAGL